MKTSDQVKLVNIISAWNKAVGYLIDTELEKLNNSNYYLRRDNEQLNKQIAELLEDNAETPSS